MLDWNGNGKIDPTDIGISIAALEEAENARRSPKKRSGCLGSTLMLALIAALPIIVLILR